MEPTVSSRDTAPRAHRAAVPFAAMVWSVLIAAAVYALGERIAGTLSTDRTALTTILTTTAAMALSALAAGLFLHAANRTDGDHPGPLPADLLWRLPIRPGSMPIAAIAVVPPLVLGLALLPEESISETALLIVVAAVATSLLIRQPARKSDGTPSNLRVSGPARGADLSSLEASIVPLMQAVAPNSTADRQPHELPRAAVPFPATLENASGDSPKRSPLAVFDPGDEEPIEEECEASPEESSGRTVLQLVRRIEQDGLETLEGQLQLELPPGCRHRNFHLSFSPPFARAPEIECEMLEGGESVRVKVGLALPWGVRLEARRPTAEDRVFLQIALQVSCIR